jgi:hypothetical protein
MHRIDVPSAIPALPTPKQPGTPGYYTDGDPTTGLQATIVSDDWCNAVQEEIAYVVEQSGLVLSKTDRTQLYQAIGRLTRIRLTAPATWYISPTGNDNNNGLTQATAWQTITKGYNYIRDHVDVAGFQTTLQLANGTYAAATCSFPVIGPAPIILGNAADASQVIVNNPNGPALVVWNGSTVVCNSFTVQAAGPAGDYGAVGSGILAGNGGVAILSNMRFGTCSQFHMDVRNGGTITMGATGKNYTIAGSAQSHMAALGGYIATADAAISISGTPAFSNGYAFAAGGGAELDAWGCTFTGAATGTRYNGQRYATINTNGAGANYFPGNAAGTLTTGALYI